MTTVAPEPPAAPAREVRSYLQLERLEYGKYCLSREGAIEAGIDHEELGRTADFPLDVAPQCDPEIIGVARSTDEDPYAPSPHGTVLRPVRSGARLLSVMGRLRMRPEDGETGTGRRYTLARYLVSTDDGPSPEQLLSAMNRQPVVALTRAEASNGLLPFRITQPGVDVAVANADPAAQAFLGPATEFALSGVPITITDAVDEDTFFRWVTQIWHLLPVTIRPLLSAGWNVAPSLSGDLLIVRTPHPAPTSARYSATSQRWLAPAQVQLRRNATRIDTSPFTEDRLVPGRSMAFLRTTGARRETWFVAAPAFDFPSVPDLRDPTTVRALRWPGLRLADDFRRRRITQWFHGGAAFDLEQERAAGDFIYADTQWRAIDDLLAALAESGAVRARADEYVWRIAENEGGGWLRESLANAVNAGSPRAHLLLALRGSATDVDVMNALAVATLANETEGLTDVAATALEAVLDRHVRSLDETGAGIHRLLLTSGHTAAEYRRWSQRNEAALLLALSRWPAADRVAAVERLMRDGSPGIEPLGRWLHEMPPDPNDAQRVESLPPEAREIFARAMASVWCHSIDRVAERRAHVLRWVEIETPRPAENALLRVALGQETASEDEIVEIIEDVERSHAPEVLNERLGTFAIAHWHSVMRSIRSHAAAWADIVDWWPREPRRLLLDTDRESAHLSSPALLEAIARLELTADEVEEMIERWSGWQERASDRPLAEQLWRFAVRARVASHPALRSVEITQELVSRRLSGLSPVDAAAVIRVLNLIAASGVSTLDAVALWPLATLPWQMVMLLRIFPAAVLQPSVGQLDALARDPAEIIPYLAETGVSQARLNLFEIATLRFHSIDFRHQTTTVWRDDLRDSFLWAVFRGVPLEQQGNLRGALDFYARDPRSRVDAIRRYLEGVARDDRPEAEYRALRDGVFPLLGRILTTRQIVDVLRHFNELREPPAGLVERWRWRWAAVIRWAQRRPIVSSRAAAPAPIMREGRSVMLADWLYELLRTHFALPSAVLERAAHDVTA